MGYGLEDMARNGAWAAYGGHDWVWDMGWGDRRGTNIGSLHDSLHYLVLIYRLLLTSTIPRSEAVHPPSSPQCPGCLLLGSCVMGTGSNK
ncbi:hypothetical protein Pcinc_014035 [Petrolisthes cinctipes]|uniref:Uncharacterized protein n=1 Tax=Petrolisthes cinctipes TaxID=88211 RepID=A0AAE1FXD6_PETCI|nr:hypothetical protein Pcinc_014035 [Petrolisthes cinctipes]